MAHPLYSPSLSDLEEVVTVLFCLIDDTYRLLNPHLRRYESLKRLSDSEEISLALLQKLRGVESERSFLRDAQRFSFTCSPMSWASSFLVASQGEEV